MNDKTIPQFYNGNDYTPEESFGYLLRQVSTIMSQVVEERMGEHGLTDAQWKPLLMIRQSQCKTAAELARLACADTGAITRLLDRVEAKGLVQRSRSQADRRVVNLELTEEGQRLAEVVPHILADVLNALLVGFNANEVAQLKSLLERLLENARNLRDEDTTRT